MKPKPKSKKSKKPSYRQLEGQLKHALGTIDAQQSDLNLNLVQLIDKDRKIKRLGEEVAEAQHNLTRQREVTGLYFAAISNPVTAKDAERIAGLQSQIFRFNSMNYREPGFIFNSVMHNSK